jgi:hypothetical protein
MPATEREQDVTLAPDDDRISKGNEGLPSRPSVCDKGPPIEQGAPLFIIVRAPYDTIPLDQAGK